MAPTRLLAVVAIANLLALSGSQCTDRDFAVPAMLHGSPYTTCRSAANSLGFVICTSTKTFGNFAQVCPVTCDACNVSSSRLSPNCGDNDYLAGFISQSRFTGCEAALTAVPTLCGNSLYLDVAHLACPASCGFCNVEFDDENAIAVTTELEISGKQVPLQPRTVEGVIEALLDLRVSVDVEFMESTPGVTSTMRAIINAPNAISANATAERLKGAVNNGDLLSSLKESSQTGEITAVKILSGPSIESSSDNDDNLSLIIAACVLAFVVLLAIALYFCCRRKQKGSFTPEQQELPMSTAQQAEMAALPVSPSQQREYDQTRRDQERLRKQQQQEHEREELLSVHPTDSSLTLGEHVKNARHDHRGHQHQVDRQELRDPRDPIFMETADL